VSGCAFWCDDGMGSGSCYPESEVNVLCTSSSSTSVTSVAGCSSLTTNCGGAGYSCVYDTDCCSHLCGTPDGSGGLTCTP
jgi:hypothetical protein